MSIIVFGSMGNDFLIPSDDALPMPGETIVSRKPYIHTPSGGKGMNQAVAATRAGSTVYMGGKVGKDDFGNAVLGTLLNEGTKTDFIQNGQGQTSVAFIMIGRHGKKKAENMIINSACANMEATADQVPDEFLQENNIVLCQMEVEPKETFDLLIRAKEKGARTILNFAPGMYKPVTNTEDKHMQKAIQSVDYLIVNEHEAVQVSAALNLNAHESDHQKIAENLVAFSENKMTCIVTLGDKGLVAVQPDNLVTTMTAIEVNVKDTTGAGDAFCGGFASALDQGETFGEALKWGMVTGGLACREIGCQAPLPYKDEIKAAVLAMN